MIECRTLFGDKRLVLRERLILRPAAYAIIMRDAQVLLVSTRSTGKWYLPGGAIEAEERIEQALRREVKEETGIEIQIDAFACFKEDFFYYDPLDAAYHSLLFFYRCTPLTFDILDEEQIADDEACAPQWIDIASLREDDFQSHGETIYKLIHERSDR